MTKSLKSANYDICADHNMYQKEYDGCCVRVQWHCVTCGDQSMDVVAPSHCYKAHAAFDFALDAVFQSSTCAKADALQYEHCEVVEVYSL